jgi:hypothetical protein
MVPGYPFIEGWCLPLQLEWPLRCYTTDPAAPAHSHVSPLSCSRRLVTKWSAPNGQYGMHEYGRVIVIRVAQLYGLTTESNSHP